MERLTDEELLDLYERCAEDDIMGRDLVNASPMLVARALAELRSLRSPPQPGLMSEEVEALEGVRESIVAQIERAAEAGVRVNGMQILAALDKVIAANGGGK